MTATHHWAAPDVSKSKKGDCFDAVLRRAEGSQAMKLKRILWGGSWAATGVTFGEHISGIYGPPTTPWLQVIFVVFLWFWYLLLIEDSKT